VHGGEEIGRQDVPVIIGAAFEAPVCGPPVMTFEPPMLATWPFT
jgi:hypothetical protein